MPSKCPCCNSDQVKDLNIVNYTIPPHIVSDIKVKICANCGCLYDRTVQEYWEKHKPKIIANPIEKEKKKLLEIPTQ